MQHTVYRILVIVIVAFNLNPKNEKNGIKFVFGLLSIKKAWEEGRKALAVWVWVRVRTCRTRPPMCFKPSYLSN